VTRARPVNAPVPPAATRVDKRRALLDAGLALFLAHGVVETTLDDLLQRSGASVGSLYHHFGGKEELADALYIECLSGYHADARTTLDAAKTNEAGVRAIVTQHLGWTSAHPDQSCYLIAYRDHEVRPASDDLRALNKSFYGYLETWLLARTNVERKRLPVVVAQWIGPAHNFARHWLTGNTSIAPRDAAGFLADGAWAALAPLFNPAPPASTPLRAVPSRKPASATRKAK
jgi:AcrR family transcriptional regulator